MANSLEVISNWIAAIGATIGAIGQTNILYENRYIGQQLSVIGKGGQGVGSALVAILEDNPQAEIGNWLIAGGASTVSYINARELPKEFRKDILNQKNPFGNLQQKDLKDIENRQISIIGNAIQSIGAYLIAIEKEHPKKVLGAKVQSIGSLIEAIGEYKNLYSLEELAQLLAVLGGWLQSIGTSLVAIGVTEEYWH
ncbi:DUF6944 family repetitive protein [Bacillus solitudinis]|uniref:DUF6944 family repetitive protein n=1 Tax=Bacillus solitudinis TaxID=2014074 RepID=UPI000C23A694|nr:hypothetical protein [Bacillus solitudinis]